MKTGKVIKRIFALLILLILAKTGVRNTRLANRAKIILALDTSGGRFRWQSMAADGSRNWKLETIGAVLNGHPVSNYIVNF